MDIYSAFPFLEYLCVKETQSHPSFPGVYSLPFSSPCSLFPALLSSVVSTGGSWRMSCLPLCSTMVLPLGLDGWNKPFTLQTVLPLVIEFVRKTKPEKQMAKEHTLLDHILMDKNSKSCQNFSWLYVSMLLFSVYL